MGRRITEAKLRSPKSKEFGTKLSTPQIKVILKLMHGQIMETPVSFEDYELESLDAAERKMKDLYLSIIGREWKIEN